MSHRTTRRDFLKASGTVPLLGAPMAFAQKKGIAQPTPASERIVMATIGCGSQGTRDMEALMGYPQVQMVAVCDVVPEHRERAKRKVDAKYGHTDCKLYSDFREVLARSDIDAVLIGTPDHWHAIITIEACKAGKDVYCEKPECLTIREGRAMAAAVARYGRVFSGGSQRVLGDYGSIPHAIWSGAIGTVKEVYVGCGGPSVECDLPEQPMPKGIDWNMWLGPAPWRPFHTSLIYGGFRPYRDYSGGQMTDWGAHRFGAALFATGRHLTGPTKITPPGPENKYLTYEFADGLKMYHVNNERFDIEYIGTEGKLSKKESKPDLRIRPSAMPTYNGNGIFSDFVHCVRDRRKTFRHIEAAHRTCTMCHLGNIAYWLNRPIRWDPEKEEIIGDPEAARWLDRPKREPWALS